MEFDQIRIIFQHNSLPTSISSFMLQCLVPIGEETVIILVGHISAFELCQGWAVRIWQHRTRYGNNNAPFLIKSGSGSWVFSGAIQWSVHSSSYLLRFRTNRRFPFEVGSESCSSSRRSRQVASLVLWSLGAGLVKLDDFYTGKSLYSIQHN